MRCRSFTLECTSCRRSCSLAPLASSSSLSSPLSYASWVADEEVARKKTCGSTTCFRNHPSRKDASYPGGAGVISIATGHHQGRRRGFDRGTFEHARGHAHSRHDGDREEQAGEELEGVACHGSGVHPYIRTTSQIVTKNLYDFPSSRTTYAQQTLLACSMIAVLQARTGRFSFIDHPTFMLHTSKILVAFIQAMRL